MKIQEALAKATKLLASEGIVSAALDSRVLLAKVANTTPEYLLVRQDEELPSEVYSNFLQMVQRRLELEPIAYITGQKEFYSRLFEVNHSTLIPRPDTELLIEVVVNFLADNPEKSLPIKILDLGTGSGCIAITLLQEVDNSQCVAIDISDEALLVAKRNALAHGVSDRLRLVKSDWFSNVEKQEFHIIVGNPPYISSAEEQYIALETMLYEPKTALFAKDEGLEAYKVIANGAKEFLAKPSAANIGGVVFVEIGFKQYNEVVKIFELQNYRMENYYKDLAGHIRVVCFALKNYL